MEIRSGTPTNKLVGMGDRIDKKTGAKEPIYNFYPTYFNHVLRTFELYPVNKIFGLTPETAMRLPVDRWYQIKKSVEAMPPNKHVDVEAELIKLVRDVISGGGGNE